MQLPFTLQSFYHDLINGNLPGMSKDTIYALLNNPRYNWRRFLRKAMRMKPTFKLKKLRLSRPKCPKACLQSFHALIRQSLPIYPIEGPLQNSYQENLAAHGANGPYKEYFGLQNNRLDANPTYPPRLVVQEFSDKVFTGFQTRAPNHLCPPNAAPEQRQHIMRKTIFNGIRFGRRFIEIYESDINKGDLNNLITAAATILGGAKPECQCR